jgi:hypothetical protein
MAARGLARAGGDEYDAFGTRALCDTSRAAESAYARAGPDTEGMAFEDGDDLNPDTLKPLKKKPRIDDGAPKKVNVADRERKLDKQLVAVNVWVSVARTRHC